MRGVGRARREVNEEWLIRNECFLLPNPVNGLIRHICHQVVALFGCFLDLDRCGALIKRWVPLVRLTSDEPVEILESSSACRPRIEGTGRTRLTHRPFMALPEL